MYEQRLGLFITVFCLMTLSIVGCQPTSPTVLVVTGTSTNLYDENLSIKPAPTAFPGIPTPELVPPITREAQTREGEAVLVSTLTREQLIQHVLKVDLVNTDVPADTEYGGGLPSLNVRWSNNGRHIAYTADYGIWIVDVNEWDKRKEVFLSHKPSELLGCCFASGPNLAWSPNDEMLAFTIFNFDKHTAGVGTYNLITDELRLVSANIGSVVDWGLRGLIACNKVISSCHILDIEHDEQYDIGALSSPFFSLPNEIVYGSGTDIMVKDLNSGQENVLILSKLPRFRSWAVNARPVPSPDGNYIAWVTQDTVAQINIYDRTQQQMLKLPDLAEPILWSSVAWSPDSHQLVFIANGTIWIMRFDL